jgi:methyl-accepting chemotaxis protein/methyl-accepting chemotaxis protein-1 (serine sensor receptor)
MFENLTLKQKLVSGFAAMAGLSLIAAICAFYSLDQVASLATKLSQVDAVKMYHAGKIDSAASDMVIEQNFMFLRAQAGDAAGVHAQAGKFQANMLLIHKSVTVVEPLLVTPEGKLLVANLVEAADEAEKSFAAFNTAILAGDLKAGAALLEASSPRLTALSALGGSMLERQRTRMAAFAADVAVLVVHARVMQIASTLLCLCCSIALWFIVTGVDRTLRDNISILARGADEVESAASQTSQSSQVLAKQASVQAAQIEEASASGQEISAMASRNVEHSAEAAELMSQMQEGLQATSEALGDAVTAMDQIGLSGDKIAKIIGVIDRIAFQTNILALNAAVEAARAGEAGMGFAVVAEEVRNLAQRSAEAARDTASLIEQNIQASGTGKVKVHLVADIGNRVFDQFGKVKLLVDGISLGNSEQGKGVSSISKSIIQMEAGTQTSAANAEQSAAAAQQLNAQSSKLRQIAADLGIMVGLGHTSSSAQPGHGPAPRNRKAELKGKVRLKLTPTPVIFRGNAHKTFKPQPSVAHGHQSDDDFRSF